MEVNSEVKVKNNKAGKILKNIFFWLFGIIIVFLLVTQVISLVTRNSNYGVANYFGYSAMYVKTDSMVGDELDSLPVGSGIITKKVDLTTLKGSSGADENGVWAKDGDIISFYSDSINAIVTHRIYEIDYDASGGVISLRTDGDNANAETCPLATGCSYPNYFDYVLPADVVGKVIYSSVALGSLIDVTTSDWFFWVAVATPLSVLLIWSVIDVIKAAKMNDVPEYLADGTSVSSETGEKLTKEQQTELLKEQYKKEIKANTKQRGLIQQEIINEQKEKLKNEIKEHLKEELRKKNQGNK